VLATSCLPLSLVSKVPPVPAPRRPTRPFRMRAGVASERAGGRISRRRPAFVAGPHRVAQAKR